MTYHPPAGPPFELDAPENNSFLIDRGTEIAAYLRQLQQRHGLITVYIGDGSQFFVSSLLAVDLDQGLFFLDAPGQADKMPSPKDTLTCSTLLDHITLQFRSQAPRIEHSTTGTRIACALPPQLLRLQRREFFRLELPSEPTVHCRLAGQRDDGTLESLQLPLQDISGGGISLKAGTEQDASFPTGRIFRECRLDVPGEGIMMVSLRVCDQRNIRKPDGTSYLKVGCEFINLPGTRLAQIQRYITRIERERKALGVA